jgi:hypothetical protein
MFPSVTQKHHLLYYLAKAVKIGSFEVLVRLDSSWENIKIHFLLLADKAKQIKKQGVHKKIIAFFKKFNISFTCFKLYQTRWVEYISLLKKEYSQIENQAH